VITLVVRPSGPDLSDERVRTALTEILDRDALIKAGTGSGPSESLKADALVLAPSQTGYAPTGPQPRDPLGAQGILTQAGYTMAAGQWTKQGQPLSVTLAAPADKEQYLLVAKEVQRELVAAGVQVKLVTPAADQLYRPNTDAAPNVLVAPRPVGDNPASVLASMYGCPPAKAANSSITPPGNITGFCDPSLQPTIDAALTGTMSLSDAIAIVEPRLWRQAIAVPLFQSADSVAVRSELSTGELTAPLNAPFSSAVSWRRNPN
jgi:ABC-type transport system substrate-binding protein